MFTNDDKEIEIIKKYVLELNKSLNNRVVTTIEDLVSILLSRGLSS